MQAEDKIIVAIDTSDWRKALFIINSLPEAKFFKIGLSLIHSGNLGIVIEVLRQKGKKIFYDAKLNDIPDQLVKSMKSIVVNAPEFVTVHAFSGFDAMSAVVDNKGSSKILAVTILTSLNSENIWELGFPRVAPLWPLQFDAVWKRELYLKNLVIALAEEAVASGVDGIVCSGKELAYLSKIRELQTLLRVVSGIRPYWADNNDQKRVTLPSSAILDGADYLVVGRAITNPPEDITPSMAFEIIVNEVELALRERDLK